MTQCWCFSTTTAVLLITCGCGQHLFTKRIQLTSTEHDLLGSKERFSRAFYCNNLKTSAMVYGMSTTGFCSAWLRLKLNTKIGLNTTHHHHHHPPTHHTNSIPAISQLLLTRFQPNYKVRFPG